MANRFPVRLLGALALTAVAIFLLVTLAMMTSLRAGNMAIWPADGIILALMLGPLRRHPLSVLIVGELATLASQALIGNTLPLKEPLALTSFISISAVYLATQRYLGDHKLFQSAGFLKYMVFATIGSLFSSVFIALASGKVYHTQFWDVFISCVGSNAVGCAVLTPLLLILWTPGLSNPIRCKLLSRSNAVLLAYICMTVGVFSQSRYPLLFVIPLGLMAVAYTNTLVVMAFAVLVTSILAVAATLSGHGPMSVVQGSAEERLLMLQAFLSIITGTSLPIAALMAEHARLKSSLITARIEAEAANAAKSAFLATISHEIRTPLNGVLGMAQVIAMDELSDRQRERLGVIRASGDTLLSILNDVLDLSKIETGKLTLETIDFDLGATLRGAVQSYETLALEKGLSVNTDISAAEGVYRGDPTRVRQILVNLISNAVKFTPSGHIDVTAERDDRCVRVSVADTGIGIPADKLQRLFARFTQVDDSTTRKYGGTGLGLSICRQLTELMGGTVSVESRDGEGSCFTAVLPLERVGDACTEVSPAAQPLDIGPGAEGLRVLAAEDNPTNQLVLRALLHSAGLDVEFVGNGAEAVEAWARGSWDLILMDVQMPVMNGPMATREIRAREAAEGRARIPIIALTANTMSHQLADYLQAGMDAHVAKPIEAGALFDALAAAVAQDRPCMRQMETAA